MCELVKKKCWLQQPSANYWSKMRPERASERYMMMITWIWRISILLLLNLGRRDCAVRPSASRRVVSGVGSCLCDNLPFASSGFVSSNFRQLLLYNTSRRLETHTIAELVIIRTSFFSSCLLQSKEGKSHRLERMFSLGVDAKSSIFAASIGRDSDALLLLLFFILLQVGGRTMGTLFSFLRRRCQGALRSLSTRTQQQQGTSIPNK